MNGHVIPDTPIAVDCWKLRSIPHARLFFLTHYHRDHMVGLDSKWQYPLYCSPITGNLLVHHLNVHEELVRTLEMGESHLVSITEDGKETMTVTLIDANHCAGAVMFLFHGYFGKVLYTGDFRFHAEMGYEDNLLSRCFQCDLLYLDNTYCDPACQFPTKEEAKALIMDLLNSHKEYDIVFAMHLFGKEDLLCEIAQMYNSWVCVSKAAYEQLKCLDLPNVFTTERCDTNMRVVPLHSLSSNSIAKWNKEWQTLVIIITALYCGLPAHPYDNIPDVHVVPYSNHSSFSELEEFVRLVKPKVIKPIVCDRKGPFGYSFESRQALSVFDKYLSDEPRHSYDIPTGVSTLMGNSIQGKFPTARKSASLKRKGSVPLYNQRKAKVRKGVVYDTLEDSRILSGVFNNQDNVVSEEDSNNINNELGKIPYMILSQVNSVPRTKPANIHLCDIATDVSTCSETEPAESFDRDSNKQTLVDIQNKNIAPAEDGKVLEPSVERQSKSIPGEHLDNCTDVCSISVCDNAGNDEHVTCSDLVVRVQIQRISNLEEAAPPQVANPEASTLSQEQMDSSLSPAYDSQPCALGKYILSDTPVQVKSDGSMSDIFANSNYDFESDESLCDDACNDEDIVEQQDQKCKQDGNMESRHNKQQELPMLSSSEVSSLNHEARTEQIDPDDITTSENLTCNGDTMQNEFVKNICLERKCKQLEPCTMSQPDHNLNEIDLLYTLENHMSNEEESATTSENRIHICTIKNLSKSSANKHSDSNNDNLATITGLQISLNSRKKSSKDKKKSFYNIFKRFLNDAEFSRK